MHIFNRPEIHLMSILKLFVEIFVSFLKREVIIISLRIENIMVSDLQGKNGKSDSVTVVQ